MLIKHNVLKFIKKIILIRKNNLTLIFILLVLNTMISILNSHQNFDISSFLILYFLKLSYQSIDSFNSKYHLFTSLSSINFNILFVYFDTMFI